MNAKFSPTKKLECRSRRRPLPSRGLSPTLRLPPAVRLPVRSANTHPDLQPVALRCTSNLFPRPPPRPIARSCAVLRPARISVPGRAVHRITPSPSSRVLSEPRRFARIVLR